MKGILLAGGNGTRLAPLTEVTNKHLLPVYDRPMILYPLQTLKDAGIEDILVVTGSAHIGRFIEFLGDGSKFGVRLTYRVQEEASGISGALALCESFAGSESVSVVLGDNIFTPGFRITPSKYGCTVYLKEADETTVRRSGCVEIEGDRAVGIEEKPEKPKSTLVATGFYHFSPEAFQIVKTLMPSGRGELEITDVIDVYVKKGDCGFVMVEGQWFDAGTFDSLLAASNFMAGLKAI
ncbi:MAG: NTP transferase domain-containing protein [Candidatus Pacebacteria bacterium]|nr:NTP transferase domain-containing protein [Candidatus Paceibacterota bacterium]MBP9832179.1 NTP transferase domain-containing protein [Candidatus Paceibacterota bacterium]